MLILTEKPSVAKDFAKALSCSFHGGYYQNSSYIITNCVGHLFELLEPADYDDKYKDWNNLPVLVPKFQYKIKEAAKKQALLVLKLIKENINNSILIATDADREGEIIARECLSYLHITDYSKIKRFWVSQALTPDVVISGIKAAQPLSKYNLLASQGFGRQHADWMVGINFSRYLTTASKRKLPVGRVQTAVLAAIKNRCDAITNFVPEKYFEYTGFFQAPTSKDIIKGLYFNNKQTRFSDDKLLPELAGNIGSKAVLKDKKEELKTESAPSLYNLNEVQKDAFKLYGYSAEKTLELVQKLYEEYKAVSYPRTPSRVMGEQNVELCKDIFSKFVKSDPRLSEIQKTAVLDVSNKHIFNNAKLEAHHAIIPLSTLPSSASESEKNIYQLIYNRFFLAFGPNHVYKKIIYILDVNNHLFQVTAREIKEPGWKAFTFLYSKPEPKENDDEQELSNVDWNNLKLIDVKAFEKYTKPPKYFNEASILTFMENPKDLENTMKLAGLGTPATRHTFIPKLLQNGYIQLNKKNIEITDLGIKYLDLINNSPIHKIADINETTRWEQNLQDDPVKFVGEIKDFVSQSVCVKLEVDNSLQNDSKYKCPLCGMPIIKGQKNWYCSGYKNGCKFPSIWNNISGARISEKDVELLTSGKTTGVKKCTSKAGKEFSCRFIFNSSDNKIEFVFDKK